MHHTYLQPPTLGEFIGTPQVDSVPEDSLARFAFLINLCNTSRYSFLSHPFHLPPTLKTPREATEVLRDLPYLKLPNLTEQDPYSTDTLAHWYNLLAPASMIEEGGGDCKRRAVFAVTLYRDLGVPARFCSDVRNRHMLVQTWYNNDWHTHEAQDVVRETAEHYDLRIRPSATFEKHYGLLLSLVQPRRRP